MLFLTEKDVELALTMEEGIKICENAYKSYSSGAISHYFQAGDPLTDDGGAYIILPASDKNKKMFGFKYAGSYPSNPPKGIPTVACTIQLCDLNNGFPICLMGANLLTSIKTASSQAVATKYMSRGDSSVMAIVGAGHQSSFQLQAVSLVRKLREIRISDVDKSRAEALAKWYLENVNSDITITAATDSQQATQGADIVTTITTSFKPVISAKSISPGTHINAMGSFTPDMQEIDCDTVRAAEKISTDVTSTTWQVAGDLIKPLKQGLIDEKAITAELGDIVTGKANGRSSDREITIFESVGFSVLDISIAIGIYQSARERGIGTDIEIFNNSTGY